MVAWDSTGCELNKASQFTKSWHKDIKQVVCQGECEKSFSFNPVLFVKLIMDGWVHSLQISAF